MSESLGRQLRGLPQQPAFNDWDQSPGQRVSAWHGIRMARDLNQTFMTPLGAGIPGQSQGARGRRSERSPVRDLPQRRPEARSMACRCFRTIKCRRAGNHHRHRRFPTTTPTFRERRRSWRRMKQLSLAPASGTSDGGEGSGIRRLSPAAGGTFPRCPSAHKENRRSQDLRFFCFQGLRYASLLPGDQVRLSLPAHFTAWIGHSPPPAQRHRVG